MLKKMREEKQKSRMPLADASEAVKEAPGLRVGKGAWKWPPVWPYDASFFKTTAEISKAAENQNQMNTMASMLTGIAQLPTDNGSEEEYKFDPVKYWGEEQEKASSELDPEAIEKLQEHCSFYLQDGISILEFGAGEESYLPKDLKLSRHVGVGLSQSDMDKNPSLTESLVVNLNNVIPERDVDSDDLRRLATEPFDAIVMTDVIEYLTSPREVFRSAWYLLKPGGRLMVFFSGKEATQNKFVEAKTKAWQDYNDDQHMWMTGSFFHFSAGDGWESLLGFDISPESAMEPDDGNPLSKLMKRGKANNLYVIQAVKGFQDETIDPENTERSVGSLCWMLPTLEDRDKDLVVPRLARAYDTAETDAVKEAIERNIQNLPKIYKALVKMDQFAFTFSMQAQMAADLVSDPDFNASDEQIVALKQGLGLRTPSEDFWAPIGELTASMEVEDKINLLGYIVPCFGSGDPAQEDALQAFVSGLKPTYAVIRSKCPDLSESDVELLGTELLANEVLKPGRSTRQQYASWLAAFTETELRELLEERKSIRLEAKEELQAYKEEKEEKQRRLEEYKRLMEEQMQNAREQRSMFFNPKTQKMEVIQKK